MPRPSSGEKIVLVLGKLEVTCKRMKLDPYIIAYTKITSKWCKDLNIRVKTIRLLEEDVGQKLHGIRSGNDLDATPKVQK